MSNDGTSRSWFCVFNNPEEHGFEGTPLEIVESIRDVWIKDNPQRTCAVIYCISEEGLKHCHAVFEDTSPIRFSAVKKMFPQMHIEPTKGNKEQAEDYIYKRGKWAEKGEIVVERVLHGEIKGAQGQRRDLVIIEELLQMGVKPQEIMSMSLSYRRYEKMIVDAYYHKRYKETPRVRDVEVRWHVGESGSGKSYMQILLAEKYGDDEVYIITNYDNPFDKYNGEKILILDEFRGQVKYSLLLNWLDTYRILLPRRYSDVYSLWEQVHICSVIPPEHVYSRMVLENRTLDGYEQLKRRIHFVDYHYKTDKGEYKVFTLPMSDYHDYDVLRYKARGFEVVDVGTPFEQMDFKEVNP